MPLSMYALAATDVNDTAKRTESNTAISFALISKIFIYHLRSS
jgi:hypothetical protein